MRILPFCDMLICYKAAVLTTGLKINLKKWQIIEKPATGVS